MTEVLERLRAAPPRSWLFVPALKAEEWIPKAARSGADAIIVDLEDATAPSEKDRARDVVRALKLAEVEGPTVFVRVNPGPPERTQDDLAAAVDGGATGVMLPKSEDPQRVIGAAWRGLALVPLIESAAGLLRAAEIAAAHEQVVAIAFGSFDFAADVGALLSDDGWEVGYARSALVVAAGAAGVAAIDTPWIDLKDPSGAGREAARVRRLGFSGKLAIHPAQVGPINDAFTPGADEVRRARGIVDALDRAVADGSGIATFEGRMIDRPLALAARRVLARADRTPTRATKGRG